MGMDSAAMSAVAAEVEGEAEAEAEAVGGGPGSSGAVARAYEVRPHRARVDVESLKRRFLKDADAEVEYVSILRRWFAYRLSKAELDVLVPALIGEEHVQHHNELMAAVVENALWSSEPPAGPPPGDTPGSFGARVARRVRGERAPYALREAFGGTCEVVPGRELAGLPPLAAGAQARINLPLFKPPPGLAGGKEAHGGHRHLHGPHGEGGPKKGKARGEGKGGVHGHAGGAHGDGDKGAGHGEGAGKGGDGKGGAGHVDRKGVGANGKGAGADGKADARTAAQKKAEGKRRSAEERKAKAAAEAKEAKEAAALLKKKGGAGGSKKGGSKAKAKGGAAGREDAAQRELAALVRVAMGVPAELGLPRARPAWRPGQLPPSYGLPRAGPRGDNVAGRPTVGALGLPRVTTSALGEAIGTLPTRKRTLGGRQERSGGAEAGEDGDDADNAGADDGGEDTAMPLAAEPSPKRGRKAGSKASGARTASAGVARATTPPATPRARPAQRLPPPQDADAALRANVRALVRGLHPGPEELAARMEGLAREAGPRVASTSASASASVQLLWDEGLRVDAGARVLLRAALEQHTDALADHIVEMGWPVRALRRQALSEAVAQASELLDRADDARAKGKAIQAKRAAVLREAARLRAEVDRRVRLAHVAAPPAPEPEAPGRVKEPPPPPSERKGKGARGRLTAAAAARRAEAAIEADEAEGEEDGEVEEGGGEDVNLASLEEVHAQMAAATAEAEALHRVEVTCLAQVSELGARAETLRAYASDLMVPPCIGIHEVLQAMDGPFSDGVARFGPDHATQHARATMYVSDTLTDPRWDPAVDPAHAPQLWERARDPVAGAGTGAGALALPTPLPPGGRFPALGPHWPLR